MRSDSSHTPDAYATEDVHKFFGDMKFRTFSLTESKSYLKGSGTVKNKSGQEVQYKWLFTFDEDGNPNLGHIGTSKMESSGTANLTKGETRDAIRECIKTHEETSALFKCMDSVILKAIRDCEYSMSYEECTKHCWYQPELCHG